MELRKGGGLIGGGEREGGTTVDVKVKIETTGGQTVSVTKVVSISSWYRRVAV